MDQGGREGGKEGGKEGGTFLLDSSTHLYPFSLPPSLPLFLPPSIPPSLHSSPRPGRSTVCIVLTEEATEDSNVRMNKVGR